MQKNNLYLLYFSFYSLKKTHPLQNMRSIMIYDLFACFIFSMNNYLRIFEVNEYNRLFII